MPGTTANRNRRTTDRRLSDGDLRGLVSEMTCACAQTGAHADAPLARELFHRVDVLKQTPAQAARALGVQPGDAAYLLAGLREDVAKDIVLALGGCDVDRRGHRKEWKRV